MFFPLQIFHYSLPSLLLGVVFEKKYEVLSPLFPSSLSSLTLFSSSLAVCLGGTAHLYINLVAFALFTVSIFCRCGWCLLLVLVNSQPLLLWILLQFPFVIYIFIHCTCLSFEMILQLLDDLFFIVIIFLCFFGGGLRVSLSRLLHQPVVRVCSLLSQYFEVKHYFLLVVPSLLPLSTCSHVLPTLSITALSVFLQLSEVHHLTTPKRLLHSSLDPMISLLFLLYCVLVFFVF